MFTRIAPRPAPVEILGILGPLVWLDGIPFVRLAMPEPLTRPGFVYPPQVIDVSIRVHAGAKG